MHPRLVHHIGHAVDDLDAAVAIYERMLGASVEHRQTVPDQGVEAVSLAVAGSRVELLAALGEDTPVGRFLDKRGPGMHHVAYLVDDLETALDEARRTGVELIDEHPRVGLFGLRVAFVHPDSVAGVLVEFVQEPDTGGRS
ncbi:MAG: methylmalonyl-CoA epimerase [Gaiellales bacterium]